MSLGLLFSGQGAQSVGMAHSLYEKSDMVKALFAEANGVLGFDLAKICFEGPNEELTKTSVCQPALYVHGYAIFSLLKEAGKTDGLKACLGLSLGELTALSAGGAMSFAEGLRTVAKRGALMQEACEQSEGGMASVIGGDAEKVQELCDKFDIEMANLNCPGQIVISGDKPRVLEAAKVGKEFGFKLIKPLNVAGAYHSRLMEPARAQFEEFLKGVEINSPEVTVFTNVTGEQVTEPQQIREMLTKQVVSPVRWIDCMENAAKLGIESYYECGPGAVLTGLGKRIDRSLAITALAEYDDLPLG